ncbi:MAG: response regulator [Desulfuromonadales bacterium]|nr:response regulator [Desulfuromonadales bacterium]
MLTEDPRAPLILVVEDDQGHVELIKRSFAVAPEIYRLASAASLREARQILEQQTPTIIFSDFRLPDGDGGMLIALANNECPVVVLTSQGNELRAVESLKTGALDYVVKSLESFAALPRIAQRSMRDWTLIQERLRAEEATRRAKHEWEQTFNAVPDLIALIDSRNIIIRANRAMAERCSLSAEELVGRTCCELMHGLTDPPPGCPHARAMRDGREHCEEVHEARLKGVFDVTVSPLYNQDGSLTACVHVMRDITERKEAEMARLEIESRLQQAQKLESLAVLAGGVAHDFNNILTIIQGHSHMARQELAAAGVAPNNIQQIENAVNRAASLCRQMLAYAGKRPLVRTLVDLGRLVDEVVELLKATLTKNVSIEVCAAGDIPAIMADRSQMHQVIMNLLINAAEAIGDTSGVVRVGLTRAEILQDRPESDFLGKRIPDGAYARLDVSDSGCGMDEKAKKRVFEPFFTTKVTGRGLGMSAILGIVTSHAGALQFDSLLGSGSCFTVFFPLPAESVTAMDAHPEQGDATPSCKGTILLVDDEEALRMVGSELLSAMGFTVTTANNGREALGMYRQQRSEIDLVLMDLSMPDMGGMEAYRMLRSLDPDVPVVLCSGYSDEEIEDEIGRDRRAGFLEKPYRPTHLREILLKMLG